MIECSKYMVYCFSLRTLGQSLEHSQGFTCHVVHSAGFYDNSRYFGANFTGRYIPYSQQKFLRIRSWGYDVLALQQSCFHDGKLCEPLKHYNDYCRDHLNCIADISFYTDTAVDPVKRPLNSSKYVDANI